MDSILLYVHGFNLRMSYDISKDSVVKFTTSEIAILVGVSMRERLRINKSVLMNTIANLTSRTRSDSAKKRK